LLVLVLEASTSAAKALLYDSALGIIAAESEPYSPDYDTAGMQDTEQVYLATIRVGRKVAKGKDVASVAVGGIWHSIAVCDSYMRPCAHTYPWTYTKASDICRMIRADGSLAAEIYNNTGCFPNVTYQPYTLRYLRENGMALDDKLFCSQGGYNFYRMTGERYETASITSGMGFINTHTKRYDDMILDFAGVRKEQFGELTDYRELRPLTRECADMLGVAAGIPVVPPYSDGALTQLGSGAMSPGAMTFSVGTSAAIRLTSDIPVLSAPPATWCYVGVDCHMAGAATAGACNCINLFKETVLKDTYSFGELEARLLSGRGTAVYLPFPFGERCPGWQDGRTGGFFGLDGFTDAPDLYAAICEGVLFNVYQCYRILVELCGEPEKMILSGGILESAKWTQLAADIFRREIILSGETQASVIGGAALALYAAGEIRDIRDFTVSAGDKVSPRPGIDYSSKYGRYLHWYELTMQDM